MNFSGDIPMVTFDRTNNTVTFHEQVTMEAREMIDDVFAPLAWPAMVDDEVERGVRSKLTRLVDEGRLVRETTGVWEARR